MRWLRLLAAAVLTAQGLGACSSRGTVTDPAAASRVPASSRGHRYGPGASAYGAGDSGYGAEGTGASRATGEQAGMPAQRVIYFPYDSDEVSPEYQPIVSANAAYLAARSDREAVLEGHADERGSPEYNIALGERRAKAVLRLLQLQGVGEAQLRVVSFGEEKPSESGHDEAAWDRNRRVEISYSSR